MMNRKTFKIRICCVMQQAPSPALGVAFQAGVPKHGYMFKGVIAGVPWERGN
jgi:hypothetical protein